MRVVVTGANRGIGKALADGYRAKGADVIGTTRNELDVSDVASVCAWAGQMEGPVDLLVCNAGVYLDASENLSSGYPSTMWEKMLATNVTGVFMTVQAMLPRLKESESGKIAIISSQMGSSTRAKGRSIIYRVSKAAALNLGLNLASALEPEGIAVGIYHPGWVRTDMGGASADIGVDEARDGLMRRFAALSLSTTGCFETWDGRPHPI